MRDTSEAMGTAGLTSGWGMMCSVRSLQRIVASKPEATVSWHAVVLELGSSSVQLQSLVRRREGVVVVTWIRRW